MLDLISCYRKIKWQLSKISYSEAVVQRCSVKNVLLKISQNSQENTCVTFLIKSSLRDFNIDIFTASTVGGKFEALK